MSSILLRGNISANNIIFTIILAYNKHLMNIKYMYITVKYEWYFYCNDKNLPVGP